MRLIRYIPVPKYGANVNIKVLSTKCHILFVKYWVKVHGLQTILMELPFMQDH